jgi:hypothetical protein
MNTTPLHEFYLAGIVAHGLILPLMAGAEAPKHAPGPKPWLRTVWAGQAVVALGALPVIFSPLHPAFGLGLAAAGCAFFGWRLSRQLCLTPN